MNISDIIEQQAQKDIKTHTELNRAILTALEEMTRLMYQIQGEQRVMFREILDETTKTK